MGTQGNRYLPTSSSKQALASHEGMSAREVYLMYCTQHKCKPNSRLLKTLPNEPNVFDAVEYDLSNNLLGPHGILPVLELVRISPRVRRVIVRDNYLDNNAVHHIMLALRHHPSVVHVDVSSNPITWTAGMSLLELVTQNVRIQKIVMEHTHIKSSIVNMIEECIHRNSSAMSEQKARRDGQRGGQAASNSLCTRLMGLKRLYSELSRKEDNPAGKIHKRNIIQGYRENLRLQGREHLADLKDQAFWTDLQSRSSADGFGLIDWETFFLISMCDDVKYEPRDVQRLKAQFAEFDRDKSGYIDLLELKDLMTSLNGGEPSHLQVHEKLKMYDADDSNTLTWDEFCLMMYEWLQGAPSVGSHGRTPATDLPRNHRAHHR